MDIFGVVLDRDGTLIEHVPYLSDPAQVALLPGVLDGLIRLHAAGIKLFLHSNQSGVGRGMFTEQAVVDCNQRMLELIGLGEGLFERICIAPEHPDAPMNYRKPSPKFIQELTQQFGVDAQRFCYMGDRASDLATAAAAGTHAIGVATGLDDLHAELMEQGLDGRFPVVDGFEAAVDRLLS